MSFNVRLFGYSGIIQVGQPEAQQFSSGAVFLNEEPCLWSQLLVCDGSSNAVTSAAITTVPDGTQMVCVEVPDGHEIRYEVVQPGVAARAVSSSSRRGSGSFNLAWSPGYTLSIIDAPTFSAQVAAFLVRAPGLDTLHIAAYTALIDGLVAAGIWSKFDVLYIFATQNAATALLNLVSTSFNGTLHGSPTFTADSGFTGVDSSAAIYIDTGFNPASGSPKYTRDSAHISEWNLTNTLSVFTGVGSIDAGQLSNAYLLTRWSGDSKAYFRVNVGISAGDSAAVADAVGHYVANRSSNLAMQGYKTGSSIFSNGASASVAVNNQNFYALAYNFNGTAFGVGHKIAALSLGSSLTAAEVAVFYTLLRAFLTAVGVP